MTAAQHKARLEASELYRRREMAGAKARLEARLVALWRLDERNGDVIGGLIRWWSGDEERPAIERAVLRGGRDARN